MKQKIKITESQLEKIRMIIQETVANKDDQEEIEVVESKEAEEPETQKVPVITEVAVRLTIQEVLRGFK